ncbi:type VI immunity family protein [Mesorhizobium sp. 1M-11]|uniref:type VI immunity family protein n=1 Tax=Mesorhizobium sp. 1M-11 TaxID=1529006 RepID=UPI0006C753F4|nr:type VI immunity family protein [Mesorhizobium sp. 1M-11]
MKLPPPLLRPFVLEGKVACRIMLDLTVYLKGPTQAELDFLIDLYRRTSPPGSIQRIGLAEFPYWLLASAPELTLSGRIAAARGIPDPYLQPVYRRIREGRAFELRYWDHVSIDDPRGSWSFSCHRIHLRNSGLHSALRVLFPLDTDVEVLVGIARDIIDNVEFISGHGGLTFAYDPWQRIAAFDHIYAQAKRYWGLDIENMNLTVPVSNTGIKTVSWLTLFGKGLSAVDPAWTELVRGCASLPLVNIERGRRGYLMRLGLEPDIEDMNRPKTMNDLYFQASRRLEPLFLREHPRFSGRLFFENADTMGWIRRFINPSDWR